MSAEGAFAASAAACGMHDYNIIMGYHYSCNLKANGKSHRFADQIVLIRIVDAHGDEVAHVQVAVRNKADR